MLKRLTALLVASALLLASLLVYTQLASTQQLSIASLQEQQEEAALLAKYKNVSRAELLESECAGDAARTPEGAVEEDEEQISEELRKIWDADVVLRSLTRRKQSDLPALSASFSEDNEQHLKSSKNYFYHLDELHQRYRVADVGLMALVAKSQSVVYSDLYTHRYDNFQDLKLAAGRGVDNEQCIRQLEALNKRADLQVEEKYRSRDLNLFQLLDTWAHSNAGLMVGNAFMEGMYHECLRLQIETGAERLATRYCVASLKHNDWPRIDKHDILSFKGGVCLPKSCDSTNYRNKYALIQRLLMLGMRVFERGQFRLHSLYCLPDEDSPLRSVWHSRPAVLTLACLSIWLAWLAYCTYKHQQVRHTFDPSGPGAKKFGLTNMSAGSSGQRTDSKSSGEQQQLQGRAYFNIYQMFSITHNIETLFDTKKESSLIDQAKRNESEKEQRSAAGKQDEQDEKTLRQAVAKQLEGKFIDLSCVEGIKVIALVYVILGHVLMCITTLIQNGRDLAGQGSVAFYLANLVPAFAVNAFFTITGTLTCYMMFKQNQSKHFITSPSMWSAFIVYRYLRIMPMYALVVLYCKTLAKYLGAGPMWDYATSALGQRRVCEQESWSWTLLFRSNFLPPMEHCIPGGWYLSNDFQFFLVTPFYLALLYKRPLLGQLALYASIIAGYLNGFHSIFSSSMSDLSPIAIFAPHGFKTYVSHFSFNYTQPQYRIPAYLIGLLVGYNLFCFERSKINFHTSRRLAERIHRKQNSQNETEQQQQQQHEEEPDWSETFKKFAVPVCLLLVAICCASPAIGPMLPFTKWGARFMVALITPSYHVMFGTAVGLYLLLATTGRANPYLNGLLAASFWKPLARVSLCAVLVNVEVINYIVQSNPNLHYVNSQYQFSLNMICILSSYVVAIVVCVLFEAPIRAALNTLLTYAIARVAGKQKAGKKD